MTRYTGSTVHKEFIKDLIKNCYDHDCADHTTQKKKLSTR